VSAQLQLTIDRLVLHGFAPEQRDGVVAGFRAELGRALAAQAAGFGASRSTPVLRVSPRRADGSAGVGEAAARQLLQGLRR
jgi:hypothetical protein